MLSHCHTIVFLESQKKTVLCNIDIFFFHFHQITWQPLKLRVPTPILGTTCTWVCNLYTAKGSTSFIIKNNTVEELMINHALPIYFLSCISAVCVLIQVILSHTNSSGCITAANQRVTPHLPCLCMLLAANALLPRTLLQ